MIILNNMPSLRANTQMHRFGRDADRSMMRLSTGLRVNNAAEDPATTAIANRFRREISGLSVASQNSLDGISIVQTADGALNEVHAILERIRELTVYGATGTLLDEQRIFFQQEIDQLLEEIENIARNTQFNGRHIFAGTFENPVDQALDADPELTHGLTHVRVGTGRDNLLAMNIPRLSIFYSPQHSGIGRGLGSSAPYPFFDGDGNPLLEHPPGNPVHTLANLLHSGHGDGVFNMEAEESGFWLSQSLIMIDSAIAEVSEMRGNMGAYQNRLTTTSAVLEEAGINMQQSLSRMVDTDMALEMTRLTQLNVKSQAGISIMAMSNQRPQQILSLLQF